MKVQFTLLKMMFHQVETESFQKSNMIISLKIIQICLLKNGFVNLIISFAEQSAEGVIQGHVLGLCMEMTLFKNIIIMIVQILSTVVSSYEFLYFLKFKIISFSNYFMNWSNVLFSTCLQSKIGSFLIGS